MIESQTKKSTKSNAETFGSRLIVLPPPEASPKSVSAPKVAA